MAANPNPFLNRFIRHEGGAVAVTYALSLLMLLAVAGVGMDYARLMGMDSELQNGADQAALAAASQLDGLAGACARATTAARELLVNESLLTRDDKTITIANESACDGVGSVRFYQTKDKATAATSDANAHFVEIHVDVKSMNYALLPVTGLLAAENIGGVAYAGLGSAICKQPPIMICHPDPSVPFNADARRGQGIVATGHSTGNSSGQGGSAGSGTNNTWSPGDFGFLQVQDGTAGSRNAKLLQALAYATPPIDCTPIDGNRVNTGNPQGLYDAVNTRFDIYDFPSNGGGNVLASCKGGDCPAAPDVTKDLINDSTNYTGQNACKIHNNGWKLPTAGTEFKPVSSGSWAPGKVSQWQPAVMGLPRDNCHYTSYNGTGRCSGGANGRFGDGNWAREDYFAKNFPSGARPPNPSTVTRYDTYLWEIANGKPAYSATNQQKSSPVCSATTGDPGRRVLTVAVVTNCAALTGASQPVVIDEWVDVFLVEPSIDDSRRYNAFRDAIYMEIIGKSKIAGSGAFGSQEVRRDVPYLIE